MLTQNLANIRYIACCVVALDHGICRGIVFFQYRLLHLKVLLSPVQTTEVEEFNFFVSLLVSLSPKGRLGDKAKIVLIGGKIKHTLTLSLHNLIYLTTEIVSRKSYAGTECE